MRVFSIGFAALLGALIVFTGVQPAQALYFEADLVNDISFSDSDVDNPDDVSGYLLTAGGLFLGLGVGYDNYTATFDESGGSDSVIDFSFASLVWSAPIPFINISAGYGIGSASPQDDLSTYFEDGDMSQLFVRLGYPIALLFDVHIGYHQIEGSLPGKTVTVGDVSATLDDVDLSGTMTTLGVRVGF